MSISTVPSCGASAPQATASSVGQITSPRPRCAESREDHGERHGHHRGAGPLRDALTEAFKSLGIDLPARSERGLRHEDHHEDYHEHDHEVDHEGEHDDDRVEWRPSVSAAPVSGGNEVGIPHIDPVEDDTPLAPVTARTVRSDLHDFMHELFDAARSAYAGATAANPGGTTAAAPGGRLAIGLSALVSQVGAGQTPPALQGAFDQLMSDLSAWRATSAPAAPADAASPAASAAPTLQQLLGALQQRLGYGSSANDVSALGNTVDLAA